VYNLLSRVDFWCLSNIGAIAAAWFREFGIRGCGMTISAQLCFFGSGTLVVYNVLTRCDRLQIRTSYWWSKNASSIWGYKWDCLVDSLVRWSITYWLVTSSCFINEIGDISHMRNHVQMQRAGWKLNIRSTMKICWFPSCERKCSLKVCSLNLLWMVTPHGPGPRFQVDEIEDWCLGSVEATDSV